MTKSIITRYTIRGILQSQHNHDQQDGPKLASCPLLLLVLTIGIATLQRRQRHARQRLPSGHSILQIFPPPPMESRHLYWCRRHHHVCPHQENKSRHAQTLHVHEEGQRGTEGLIVVWSTATFLLPHHRLSCSPCSHSDSHHPRWRTTSQGVPCRHNHLQHCPKHIPRQSLTSHAQQKRHPNPEPLLVN